MTEVGPVAKVGMVQLDKRVEQKAAEEASREASSEKDRSLEMLMVKKDVVEAVLQALDRGGYGTRRHRPAASMLNPYAEWLAARAPEVGFNAVILHRGLREQGFRDSEIIVRGAVRPLRDTAPPPQATVRFESAPGEQAQVDFGQTRVRIEEVSKDHPTVSQTFVCTLGYSRRSYAVAFPRQRLRDWLSGHEQASQHFGGSPDRIVVDNAKGMVLTHTRDAIVWHPTYADFAGYYGFRPWECTPYRPQTKGKVESGVKYVKRNALAGKRFLSWSHLNAWLLEWTTTVADLREHGTTHEAPLARLAAERLTPLGVRPLYQWACVRQRVVANDALVSIAGSRYSVPTRLVGAAVSVHELSAGFEIRRGDAVVAEYARQHAKHQFVMQPEHYAGLLRVDRTPLQAAPPQYDPRYPRSGEVAVRDLSIYEEMST